MKKNYRDILRMKNKEAKVKQHLTKKQVKELGLSIEELIEVFDLKIVTLDSLKDEETQWLWLSQHINIGKLIELIGKNTEEYEISSTSFIYLRLKGTYDSEGWIKDELCDSLYEGVRFVLEEIKKEK